MSIRKLDRNSTALLVIDAQNAFCHQDGTLGLSGVDVGAAQAAYAPIRRVATAAKRAGIPVIWTQQIHIENDKSRAAKRLDAHASKHKKISALAGTWDSDFVDELVDLVDDPLLVVTKHRFGAFYETRLEALLNMLGVEALLVAGFTANACVETTLREAYLRDYDVAAVTDCIASARPEWLGFAQDVWAHYLGVLTTSDEVIDWLDTDRPGKPVAIGHVLMQTTDLAVSESFYVETLGFAVAKRERFRDGRPLVVTEQGLGLTTGRSGSGQVDHFAFRVEGVADLTKRAVAAGHEVVRELGPGPHGLTVYLADPDGNEIELYEVDDGGQM